VEGLVSTIKPVLSVLLREHWNSITYDRWSVNAGLINMKCTVKGS
jgi:hypothetical protein